MISTLRHPVPIRRLVAPPEDALFLAALQVVEIIRKAGYQAYLVGGSIRDLVMQQTPNDYDVATSAEPEMIQRLFPRTIAVGIQFGTVMVLWRGHSFEVTTFRNDGRYLDGRRPTSVTWAEVTDDVQRRDFTINGLLFDPLTSEVIDYVGGLEDIAAKELHTIGDPIERFQEDRLRMLRAIRFVARLGFAMDGDVVAAIREMAPRIQEVSIERIQTEIAKMFLGADPARALELLHDTGLLAEILPQIRDGQAAILRFQAASQKKLRKTEAFFLALLFFGLPLKITEDTLRLMRWSNEIIQAALDLLLFLPKVADLPRASVAQKKRLLRVPFAAGLLDAAEVLVEVGEMPPEGLVTAKERLSVWTPLELSPPKFISGEDLKRLGFKPGPHFKTLLETLEDAQLEGQIEDRAAAEAWLLRLHALPPSPSLS